MEHAGGPEGMFRDLVLCEPWTQELFIRSCTPGDLLRVLRVPLERVTAVRASIEGVAADGAASLTASTFERLLTFDGLLPRSPRMTPAEVEALMGKTIAAIEMLRLVMLLRQISDDAAFVEGGPEPMRITQAMEFLRRVSQSSARQVITTRAAACILRPDLISMGPEFAGITEVSLAHGVVDDASLFDSDVTKYQRFLGKLLLRLRIAGFAKLRGFTWKRIYVVDPASSRRQFVHAYEPLISGGDKRPLRGKQLVYSLIDKNADLQEWKDATSKGNSNITQAADYLAECNDPEFPLLRPSRSAFAFRNGVWDAEGLVFYPHAEVPETLVACNFIDKSLDPVYATCADPREIPTPAIDGLLDYQIRKSVIELRAGDPDAEPTPEDLAQIEEVKTWVYVFLGKLLFPLNKHERWQVMMAIIGVAQTGKTTISNIIQMIYRKEDIQVLDNHSDKKYALATVVTGYCWIVGEGKEDFDLPQTRFQQMITGETMQLHEKYAQPFSTRWDVPGFYIGNRPPGYRDNANSVMRRVLVVGFLRRVDPRSVDPELETKIAEELPKVIVKISRCYRLYAERYRRRDLWAQRVVHDPATGAARLDSVLPPYFHNTRQIIAEATNPVAHFMAHGEADLVLFPGRHEPEFHAMAEEAQRTMHVDTEAFRHWMPLDVFRDLAVAHIKEHFRGEKFTWSKENYESVLAALNLRIVSTSRRVVYNGAPKQGRLVLGVTERKTLEAAGLGPAAPAAAPAAPAAAAPAAAAAAPAAPAAAVGGGAAGGALEDFGDLDDPDW